MLQQQQEGGDNDPSKAIVPMNIDSDGMNNEGEIKNMQGTISMNSHKVKAASYASDVDEEE